MWQKPSPVSVCGWQEMPQAAAAALLSATAHPERLRAALPALGLAWLAERQHGPATLTAA